MNLTIDATLTQLVTALAALTAAFVGPCLAYGATRRAILSGRRVDWNLELRETISEFVTVVWQAASTTQTGLIPESRLGELLERMQLTKTKIELLVNPGEPLHQQLCESTTRLVADALEYRRARDLDEKTKDQIRDRADASSDEVVRIAKNILKTEWEKAKRFK